MCVPGVTVLLAQCVVTTNLEGTAKAWNRILCGEKRNLLQNTVSPVSTGYSEQPRSISLDNMEVVRAGKSFKWTKYTLPQIQIFPRRLHQSCWLTNEEPENVSILNPSQEWMARSHNNEFLVLSLCVLLRYFILGPNETSLTLIVRRGATNTRP